jgi:hypothetical protein
MVKFSRERVQALVRPPQTVVTIEGCLTNGTSFKEEAILRVQDNDARKK